METKRSVSSDTHETYLRHNYFKTREEIQNQYYIAKQEQSDAKSCINWDLNVDLNNPLGVDDNYLSLFGSDVWESLDESSRTELRFHLAAWQFSQFLHAEEGALIGASKVVQKIPGTDRECFAATQVLDEARHVEVFGTFLNKLGFISSKSQPKITHG